MTFSPLDFLFPKRCVSCRRFGAYICKNCFARIEFIEKPVCPICQRQAVGGKTHPACAGRFRLDGLVVACRYQGPIKAAITKIKYRWVYDLGNTLVDLLSSNLWKFDLPNGVVLIPVPLHVKRRNWRGFNQAEILTKNLAKKFNLRFLDSLNRVRETKSQIGLKRDERKGNVRGAFKLSQKLVPSKVEGSLVKGQKFLLVDDVYTSGATMAECCQVLKRAGADEVWAMAVALG